MDHKCIFCYRKLVGSYEIGISGECIQEDHTYQIHCQNKLITDIYAHYYTNNSTITIVSHQKYKNTDFNLKPGTIIKIRNTYGIETAPNKWFDYQMMPEEISNYFRVLKKGLAFL